MSSVAQASRDKVATVGELLEITPEDTPDTILTKYAALNYANDNETNADARNRDAQNGS